MTVPVVVGPIRMNWTRYRQLCDRGDVLSRLLLLRTALLLEQACEAGLAARLRAVTEGAAIAKPGDHRGGADTDFFITALAQADVARIVAVVRAAAADVRLPAQDGRRAGALPEAWQEYLAWLDGSHPRSPFRRNDAEPPQEDRR